jgi:hypothetical protein
VSTEKSVLDAAGIRGRVVFALGVRSRVGWEVFRFASVLLDNTNEAKFGR